MPAFTPLPPSTPLPQRDALGFPRVELTRRAGLWAPAGSALAVLALSGCLSACAKPDTGRMPDPVLTPSTRASQKADAKTEAQRYAERMNAAADQIEPERLAQLVAAAQGAPLPDAAASKGGHGDTRTAARAATPTTPAVATQAAATQATTQPPVAAASQPATQPVAVLAMAAAETPKTAATPTAAVSPAVAMTSMTALAAPEAMAAAPAHEAAIGDLLPVLRDRAKTGPNQLAYALALQLIESAESGKPADGAAFASFPAADQKLLTDLTAAIQAMAAQPSGTASVSDRAAPLTAAAAKWQADGDLKLPRLALASRVDSYGVYTPVDTKFENGKRHVVIIYCEVANFASRKTAEGLYQTVLTQQDTLITDDGLLVWRPNPEEVQDLSRNQRHDFYLVKKLTLPETLAIGKYTLRLSVTDKATNKITMATLPIEIVPAGK